jgi:hypothetical protein
VFDKWGLGELDLGLARIIEPVSKPGGLRVLEEAVWPV